MVATGDDSVMDTWVSIHSFLHPSIHHLSIVSVNLQMDRVLVGGWMDRDLRTDSKWIDRNG